MNEDRESDVPPEPDEAADLTVPEVEELAAPQASPVRPIPSDPEFVTAYEQHSGPMPGHRWLEKVEALHPGATELMLNDFAEERQHQRMLQAKAVELDDRNLQAFSEYQTLRLKIAGAVAVFFAVAGLALIFFNKPIQGFVLLVSEIAVLVLALYGRRAKQEPESDD
jgi:hypothetical protein